MSPFLLGGGTVEDVQENSYALVSDTTLLHHQLEIGLQNFAGIVGLNRAIKFLNNSSFNLMEELGQELFDFLQTQKVELLNQKASPTIAFHTPSVDSHKLAIYLSENGIMCRSGYFCCHYYLKEKQKLPPLLRISFGLHNTRKDLETLKRALTVLIK